MASNFPTSLDPSPGDPLATNFLNSPPHHTQHAFANDAIVTIQTYLGIVGSAIASSITYLLTNVLSIDPGHKHTMTSLNIAAAAHNLLVGAGTNAPLVNIAPGSAGSVLTSNGAAADPSYQTISNAQLISAQTAAETITAGQTVAIGLFQSDGGPLIDVATGANTTASAGSKTIGFTVGANSNRMLVVVVNTNSGSSPSCAYNAASMTLTQDSGVPGGGAVFRCRIYTLIAPSTGANNLVITGLSGSENFSYTIHSYYNVKQTSNPSSSIASVSPSSQSSISTTTTPVNIGALVFSSLASNGAGSATYTNMTGNQATIGTLTGSTGRFSSGDSYQLGSIGALTASASIGGSIDWVMATIVIEPFTVGTFAVWKASSASASSYNANVAFKEIAYVGFATTSATVGGAISVAVAGVVTGLTSLTPSSVYYLQDTGGTIGLTPGTITRKAALSLSTTTAIITNIF